MVDESYQRGLSERSVALIRKLVEGWDWRHFKAPCVTRVGGDYHVVDGQHTAIAAATLGIEIPVLIVSDATLAERAQAFISHNKNRLSVTGLQLHRARVTAGDIAAQGVDEACRRARVTLRAAPLAGVWQVGESSSIAAIRRVVERKGAAGATRVLRILVEANRAPIRGDEISAVALLLWEREWAGTFADLDLAAVIAAQDPELWRLQAGKGSGVDRRIAVAWYRRLPRRIA